MDTQLLEVESMDTSVSLTNVYRPFLVTLPQGISREEVYLDPRIYRSGAWYNTPEKNNPRRCMLSVLAFKTKPSFVQRYDDMVMSYPVMANDLKKENTTQFMFTFKFLSREPSVKFYVALFDPAGGQVVRYLSRDWVETVYERGSYGRYGNLLKITERESKINPRVTTPRLPTKKGHNKRLSVLIDYCKRVQDSSLTEIYPPSVEGSVVVFPDSKVDKTPIPLEES